MSSIDFDKCKAILLAIIEQERKWKDEAVKDRLVDLASNHAIAIRTLEKFEAILNDVAAHYGENR